MKMAKKTTCIAFLLLVTAFNSYSMEPETKQPSWLTWLGVELLGGAQSSPKTLENRIAELPEDIKVIIVGFLAMKDNATSVEEAGKIINSLTQVNKETNTLINEPQFCLKIIKHLAKKFNCSDETAARALATKEAQRRLAIQKEAQSIIWKNILGQKHELLSQEVDISFIYDGRYPQYGITTETLLILRLNHFPDFNTNAHMNFIINLIERSKDVINYQDTDGNTALYYFLNRISDTRKLRKPKYQNYVLTIIKTLLDTGANPNLKGDDGRTVLFHALEDVRFLNNARYLNDTPNEIYGAIINLLLSAGADAEPAIINGETPLTIAQDNGNQKIIDLITSAIKQKHSKKE